MLSGPGWMLLRCSSCEGARAGRASGLGVGWPRKEPARCWISGPAREGRNCHLQDKRLQRAQLAKGQSLRCEINLTFQHLRRHLFGGQKIFPEWRGEIGAASKWFGSCVVAHLDFRGWRGLQGPDYRGPRTGQSPEVPPT